MATQAEIDGAQALGQGPSREMRGHEFPDLLYWQDSASTEDEYGAATNANPIVALPCYLEVTYGIESPGDGDYRVPMTKAYLSRDSGVRPGDRFILADLSEPRCLGVKNRQGAQTVMLAVT